MSFGKRCIKSTNLFYDSACYSEIPINLSERRFSKGFPRLIFFLLFCSGSHNSPLSNMPSHSFKLPGHFWPLQEPTGWWAIMCSKVSPPENLVPCHKRLQVQIWHSSVAASIEKALIFFQMAKPLFVPEYLVLTMALVSDLLSSRKRYFIPLG